MGLFGRRWPNFSVHRSPIGQTCHYCGAAASTWDHVVPKCRGGTNAQSNLVPACKRCNNRKGSMSYDEFMVLLGLAHAFQFPVDGQHFSCPGCSGRVYKPNDLSPMYNARVKGEPRTRHSCEHFPDGYPTATATVVLPPQTVALPYAE